jgi:hypothetical protein
MVRALARKMLRVFIVFSFGVDDCIDCQVISLSSVGTLVKAVLRQGTALAVVDRVKAACLPGVNS